MTLKEKLLKTLGIIIIIFLGYSSALIFTCVACLIKGVYIEFPPICITILMILGGLGIINTIILAIIEHREFFRN